MLSRVALEPGQKVLDLGCGCGLVGVYAAGIAGAENVVLCDCDARAVAAARGSSMEEVEAIRARKARERGGFAERILLIDVDG